MRRLSDRARLEGMLALRRALEAVRRAQPGRPVLSVAPDPEPDETKWWQRPEATHTTERTLAVLPDAPPEERGIGLAAALDRIADSIERIAAQLDSYHVEREQHLDAIEFLLREMLIGTVQPTSASAVVFGGVVGPVDDPLDEPLDDDISIIPDGTPLAVDCVVEVRSRFHDRWISGFTIAEAVDEPGRLRYRLTRRSDGIPLPILFDACDVRAATAVDRAPTTAPPLSRSDTRTGA
jgi:hypothetical protein